MGLVKILNFSLDIVKDFRNRVIFMILFQLKKNQFKANKPKESNKYTAMGFIKMSINFKNYYKID